MVIIEGGRGVVVEQCGPLFHLKYLKGENLQTYLHLKYIAKPFFFPFVFGVSHSSPLKGFHPQNYTRREIF